MSTVTNRMREEWRREEHRPVNLDVVEFDTDPIDTPERIVTSFMVEQNSHNDWLYFTDQHGERMPLPDADDSSLRAGGFVFAAKRMGYYHKNDGTYTLEALNKTAAYFVPAPAVASTNQLRPITFSAADYEIILAIEAAMIEEIDRVQNAPVLLLGDGGPEMVIARHAAYKQRKIDNIAKERQDARNAMRRLRASRYLANPEHTYAREVIELPACMDPVVAPSPDRNRVDRETSAQHAMRMMAEDEVIKARLANSAQQNVKPTQKPAGEYVLAEKLLDSMFGWNCNEKSRHETKAAAIDAGNALMARYDSEGHEESLRFAVILKGREIYGSEVHRPCAPDPSFPTKPQFSETTERPSEAIERAFFEAETLEEALDTGYLEHVYDGIDMLGVVNPEPPQREPARKKSTISPNHPEFLKFFEPVERGAPVLGAILRGDCPRCHTRPANEKSRLNSQGWCDHCNAPKGNGDGKVGDYLTREELSANAKAMNWRKRHHCGVCGMEVEEDQIEPIAKKGEKQKAALCINCHHAALFGLNSVSPGNGPDAE